MKITTDSRGDLICAWCSIHETMMVIHKHEHYVEPVLNPISFIPLGARKDYYMEFIHDNENYVVGLQCPSCKRKVMFK